ncbi:MAG: hypothetical protein U0L73_11980 [Ruminococcus bromii]|nr:hypothetical protein [Ruminococcus bromii]
MKTKSITRISAMVLSLIIAITSLTVLSAGSVSAASFKEWTSETYNTVSRNATTLSLYNLYVNANTGAVHLNWRFDSNIKDIKSFSIYRAVGNKYTPVVRINNPKARSYDDNAYFKNTKLYSSLSARGNNVFYKIKAECQDWLGHKYTYSAVEDVTYIRPPAVNYQWSSGKYLNVTLRIRRTMGTPEIFYAKSKNGKTAYTGWTKCNLKGTYDKKNSCDVYKDVAKGLKKGEYIKYRIRYKYQGISASKYTDTTFIRFKK